MRPIPRLGVALVTAIVLAIAFLASAMADRCLMGGQQDYCCPEGPALIAVNGGCACMAPAGPELENAQESSRSVSPVAPVITFTLPPVPVAMSSTAIRRASVEATHPPGELVNPVRLRTLRI